MCYVNSGPGVAWRVVSQCDMRVALRIVVRHVCGSAWLGLTLRGVAWRGTCVTCCGVMWRSVACVWRGVS